MPLKEVIYFSQNKNSKRHKPGRDLRGEEHYRQKPRESTGATARCFLVQEQQKAGWLERDEPGGREAGRKMTQA